MKKSDSSNCADDLDRFLFTVGRDTTASPAVFQLPPTQVIDPLATCMVLLQDSSFSLQESNVLVYIAGYVVRKLKGKVCVPCREKLEGPIDPADHHHQLLAAKCYSGCTIGLAAPSCLLSGCVDRLEVRYREVIDDCIHGDNVKATLVTSLVEAVDLTLIQCDTCHVESMVVHLMVNIRLHHTLREINRTLRDYKNRKNRKTLKVCHS